MKLLIICLTIFEVFFTVEGKEVICKYRFIKSRSCREFFIPEDIDYRFCTQIHFGNANMDPVTFSIVLDDHAEHLEKLYERVMKFKEFGMKVFLSVGFLDKENAKNFSEVANDKFKMETVSESAIGFVMRKGFDGLNINWLFPICWGGDCSLGPNSDKNAFTLWIKHLRSLFDIEGRLLTADFSSSIEVVKQAYEFPKLLEYFDYINILNYDYLEGPKIPTYHLLNPHNYDNLAIRRYLQQGVSAEKLMLEIPMNGRMFKLRNWNQTKNVNVTLKDIRKSSYVRNCHHDEICYILKQPGWKINTDFRNAIGPFAYNNDKLIIYDDVEQIRRKGKFIKEIGLGGAMISSLSSDDYLNSCNCETFPLLKSINRVIRDYPPPKRHCF